MNIYLKFASIIAVTASLLFAGATSKAAQGGHVHGRAARVRKRVRKQAVRYVCPMHPDMRSRSRGECPKCGMELVRERRRKDRAVVLFH